MSDVYAIRRKNLLSLLGERGDGAALAEAAGILPQQLSALKSRINITKTMAGRLEAAAKMPAGWLSTEHQKELDLQGINRNEFAKRMRKIISLINRGKNDEAIDALEHIYTDLKK